MEQGDRWASTAFLDPMNVYEAVGGVLGWGVGCVEVWGSGWWNEVR